MLSFSIQIPVAELDDISRNIIKEFTLHINKAISASIPSILEQTRRLVARNLSQSPTWAALNGGNLSQILCLPSPAQSLSQIERAIVDGVSILNNTLSVHGDSISGGFNVNILDDKFANITNLSTVSYTTTNGKLVPWLEWLLFYGTSPLAINSILINTSRGVLLVRAKENLFIPNEHAGIKEDNFITRSLKPLEQEIAGVIQTEMGRRV